MAVKIETRHLHFVTQMEDGEIQDIVVEWWEALYLGMLGMLCMLIDIPLRFWSVVHWVFSNDPEEKDENIRGS